MKVYKLDKFVAMNREFTMETYRAYIIEAWGTDDGMEVTARVDAKKVGAILDDLAPLRVINVNTGGPISLEDKPIVVPPDKTLKFEGTDGRFVHITGKIIELAMGEALPPDYLTRFEQQHNLYYTCVKGPDNVGTDTNMLDGAEVEIYTLTPTTIEEYVFNHRMYVDQTATGDPAEAEGNLGVRLYLDGVPFDHILAATGRRGMNRFEMEPPLRSATYSSVPFTLKDHPITVPGDKTLSVTLMNVSGTTLFTVAQATFTFYAVALYKKSV